LNKLPHAAKTCYEDFISIISKFPSSLHDLILTEFTNNSNEHTCCLQEQLIKNLSDYYTKKLNILFKFINEESKKAKNGLGVFYIPQNIINDINPENKIDENFQNEISNFIRENIVQINTINNQLSSCVFNLMKISIQNISLMCTEKKNYDIFFQKNYNDLKNNPLYIINGIKSYLYNLNDENKIFENNKHFANVYLEIYKECNEYTITQEKFGKTIIDSGVDTINLLNGSSECNYFSRNFIFDPEKDKEDEIFQMQQKYNMKNENIETDYIDILYNNSHNNIDTNNEKDNEVNDRNNPNYYLDSWYGCIKQKFFQLFSTQTNQNKVRLENEIDNLYKTIPIALYKNPQGLSTYIGRFDIDFSIIKKTFDITSFSYFHIICENRICEANCPICSSSDFSWDNLNVVKSDSTFLEISCCDKLCVIYIRIIDSFNNNNNSNYNVNNYNYVMGAEIFHVKNSNYIFDISPLEIEKIKNANKSFEEEDINFEDKKNHNNYTRKDSDFQSEVEEIIKRSNKYIKDIRLSYLMYLNLDIKNNMKFFNGNLFRNLSSDRKNINDHNNKFIQLNDFIYENLMLTNSTFYFECDKGKCIYECKICPSIDFYEGDSQTIKIEFNLNPNNSPNINTLNNNENENKNINNIKINDNSNYKATTSDFRILTDENYGNNLININFVDNIEKVQVYKGGGGGGRGGRGGSSSKGSSFGKSSASHSNSHGSSISSSSSSKGSSFTKSSASYSNSSGSSISHSSSTKGSSFSKSSGSYSNSHGSSISSSSSTNLVGIKTITSSKSSNSGSSYGKSNTSGKTSSKI